MLKSEMAMFVLLVTVPAHLTRNDEFLTNFYQNSQYSDGLFYQLHVAIACENWYDTQQIYQEYLILISEEERLIKCFC